MPLNVHIVRPIYNYSLKNYIKMKYIFLVVVFINLLIPSKGVAQSNKSGSGGAAIVGAAVAGVIIAMEVEVYKEAFERHMTEWVFKNKDFSKKMEFELKLFKWEATKKADLSMVSVIGYKFTKKDEEPVILLSACSPGWTNEYGVDFAKVHVYEIDKNLWGKIMLTYMNLAKIDSIQTIFDIEKIPVFYKKNQIKYVPIFNLSSVNLNNLEFEIFENNVSSRYQFDFSRKVYGDLANGDLHTAIDFDSDFKVDFNEGNLNLFLKKTGDLIKLKRDLILEINKTFFPM